MTGKPDELHAITVRLPPELVRRIKIHCAEYGLKIQNFAQEAFEAKLAVSVSWGREA